MTLPIELRRARKSDIPFITSSWLKSNRYGYLPQSIPNTVYYHQHHKILEEVIPRSVVLVACNHEDPDQILGWMCAEVVDTAMVIHYVYIKKTFRKFGLAKRLVETMAEVEKPPAFMCTHSNREVRDIVERHKIIYNPYLLFDKLPEGWSTDDQEDSQ
tara:strand:- start:342 stop:815 length:474 start_codon:yes stop_codon:yes gene_type:complete